MPYLPVDLDAKRKAEMVDSALGLPRHTTIGGLLDLWEHVWREKRDVVGDLYLSACIGPGEKIRAALVEVGFLEKAEEGYRIRGAKKWLLGMEGRSRGGHAAKGNLVPGGKKKAAQPSPAEDAESNSSAPAESQPRASRDPLSAHTSALTPSIQHPASKKESPPTRARELPDLPPLIERIGDTFRAIRGAEYVPTFPDQQALRPLLQNAKGDEGEILRRWDIALRRQRFPQCNSLVDLAKHWNAYAQPESTAGPPVRTEERPRDPNRPTGIVSNPF